jgi:23S rRNA (uridine2552-2'-O)-methyltransferase
MSFKVKDYYFKKAKKENYLARSVYKLEEVNSKYKVLDKANSILDLGYHPGSWTQYASKIAKTVVGIDIKPVNEKLQSLTNVQLFESDAFEVHDLGDLGVNDKFDVVLSDMAPNTTGIKDVDQQRSLDLVVKVFNSLVFLLKPGGNLVIKIFDSHDAQMFIKENQKRFKEIKKLKPKSTRSISKEFFLIGKGFIE